MQQTTSGEIPKKVLISESSCISDFIDREHDVYQSLENKKNCLYDNKSIIDDVALNYFNLKANNNLDLQLKSILYSEFDKCEKMYPFLGDVFISRFFGRDGQKNTSEYFFKKRTANEFLNSLTHKQNKEILDWIINNSTMEYSVGINNHVFDHISVEKIVDCEFKVKYDSSFLGGKNYHKMSDYKFIIIDGHIESVGEIHHLLDQAYKTKVPHVIFCFGMSEDVSHVIKYNNTHSKFEVFPFIAEFNENTINLLHDIAVLHQDQVVTSKSGQTISQAVRGELKFGKEIIFHRQGFKIKPNADSTIIKKHREFLQKRISESQNEENSKLLKARSRAFSGKGIKIFLPESMTKNVSFLRELDYMLRFLRFSRGQYVKINGSHSRDLFIPPSFLKIVDNKVSSLKSTYSKIEKVIHYARP